jgi:hypothetical protein
MFLYVHSTVTTGTDEDDFDHRMEFCTWVLEKDAEAEGFANSIVWSDEGILRWSYTM